MSAAAIRADLAMLAAWPARRWAVATAATLGFVLLVAVPTDLIDNPAFSRAVPATWWAWPALLLTSALGGLLLATYVYTSPDSANVEQDRRAGWRGYAGGMLTYFAVGCPVCNKLALLALGSAGALTWFQPVQPFLQGGGTLLVAFGLWQRLRGERECPVPASTQETTA